MEKRTVLELLKQELMVAGGDFDNVHAADQQDMAEQGFQNAEYVSSGNMKGKDVLYLQKSVPDKLAYLDEESDDGFGDVDLYEMFSHEVADDFEDDSDFKMASKGGAAKLLKEVVFVEEPRTLSLLNRFLSAAWTRPGAALALLNLRLSRRRCLVMVVRRGRPRGGSDACRAQLALHRAQRAARAA